MVLIPLSPTEEIDGTALLVALNALKKGDFSVELPLYWVGIAGKIADTFNEVIAINRGLSSELARLSEEVGKQGKTRQRAAPPGTTGAWADCVASVNSLIDDLVHPTRE